MSRGFAKQGATIVLLCIVMAVSARADSCRSDSTDGCSADLVGLLQAKVTVSDLETESVKVRRTKQPSGSLAAEVSVHAMTNGATAKMQHQASSRQAATLVESHTTTSSLFGVPSQAEVNASAHFLLKNPHVCDPAIVVQECSGATDNISLADALQVTEQSVQAFFQAANITEVAPTCQDLCEKAYQLIPEDRRPPRHYVGGEWINGSIEWTVDLTPSILSSISHQGLNSSINISEVSDDLFHSSENISDAQMPSIDTLALPAPPPLGVAAQILEIFQMFPVEDEVAGNLLEMSGKVTWQTGWNPDLERPKPAPPFPADNYHWKCSDSECDGLNRNHRAIKGHGVPQDPHMTMDKYKALPCCICWERSHWPAGIQKVHTYAKIGIWALKSNLPKYLPAKQHFVSTYFGFHYVPPSSRTTLLQKYSKFDVGSTLEQSNDGMSARFDHQMQKLWQGVDQQITFCYDQAADPYPGKSYLLGWADVDRNVIGLSPDGMWRSVAEVVKTFVHEMAHLGPLTAKHSVDKMENAYQYADAALGMFDWQSYR